MESYNKYRSPEATAKLVEVNDEELTLDFFGSFCLDCGVSDYFEDFIYEIKLYADVEMAILGFERIEPEKFRVKFTFKVAKLP